MRIQERTYSVVIKALYFKLVFQSEHLIGQVITCLHHHFPLNGCFQWLDGLDGFPRNISQVFCFYLGLCWFSFRSLLIVSFHCFLLLSEGAITNLETSAFTRPSIPFILFRWPNLCYPVNIPRCHSILLWS